MKAKAYEKGEKASPKTASVSYNNQLFQDKEIKQRIYISRVRIAGRFFEALYSFIILLSLYFFFNFYPFRLAPSFLAINLIALLGILVYHRLIFQDLSKKNPTLALNVDISAVILMLILLSGLSGGIASPMFFIYFVVLAATAFAFFPYFVFISLFLEFIVIYFSVLYDPIQLSFVGQFVDLFIWEIVLLSVFSVLFFVLSSLFFEQKKAKEKLEDFTNQLVADKVKSEAVLQSMSDGVFVVDREKRLIFTNEAAENLIKISQKQKENLMGHFYGNVFKFRIGDKDLDYTKECPLQLAITEGKPNNRKDLALLTFFKKPVFIALSSAPVIDAAGNAQGAVAVIRDITKEKEIEKMQMEFISIASHELLTPITQVQGHLSMMVEEHIGKMDETALKLAGNAFKGIRRIARLVKDLMNVSRIERGAMKINLVEIEIEKAIESLIKDFQMDAQSLGLKLLFKKPAKRMPFVLADMDRLSEVLTNLIGNALKFTKSGGIILSVLEKRDGFVVVSVSDTGIGIPKENLEKLFDKFYQVDSSATREAEGTGLGLYISKTIIEMMGGKIWVESKPGKGSIFSFSLPIAKEAKSAPKSEKVAEK